MGHRRYGHQAMKQALINGFVRSRATEVASEKRVLIDAPCDPLAGIVRPISGVGLFIPSPSALFPELSVMVGFYKREKSN